MLRADADRRQSKQHLPSSSRPWQLRAICTTSHKKQLPSERRRRQTQLPAIIRWDIARNCAHPSASCPPRRRLLPRRTRYASGPESRSGAENTGHQPQACLDNQSPTSGLIRSGRSRGSTCGRRCERVTRANVVSMPTLPSHASLSLLHRSHPSRRWHGVL